MTTTVVPLSEEQVRSAIDALIAQKDQRLQTYQATGFVPDAELIEEIGRGVDELTHLKHMLGLCERGEG
jgi:hypothetical protein